MTKTANAITKENKKTAPLIEASWLLKQRKKKTIVLHHKQPVYKVEPCADTN